MHQTTTPSLRELLLVIFKYWKMIVTLVILTVTLVTIGSYVLPEFYEAKAKILVKFGRQNTDSSAVIPSNPVLLSGSISKEHVASEVEILSSSLLVKQAIESVGEARLAPPLRRGDGLFATVKYYLKRLAQDISGFIQDIMVALDFSPRISDDERLALRVLKNLNITPVRNTDVIEIVFRWPLPEEAADFVTALVQHYQDYYLDVHKEHGMLKFLDNTLQRSKRDLENTEQLIKQFKRDNDIFSLPEQRSLLLNQKAQLESGLQSTEQQIAETANKLEVLDSQPTANLVASQTHLMLKADLNGLTGKKKVLIDDLHDTQRRLVALDEEETALSRLQRQRTIDEHNYELYNRKHEEQLVTELMDKNKIVDFRVIEPASKPLRPTRFISFLPRKLFNIIAALVGGLLIAIVLAYLRDYADRRLDSKRKIEQTTGMPVLASIPQLNNLS